ncbi:MAG: DUF262 domain-containing protein [Nitrospirae bacterium]|nr:DUF262 domain-containing protein [Nitrospirota bacterium]MBF0535739.1 DUF262 domain-containing protein [Nitrospirota bacterium]MBF0615768.1 DUF262 domain-containing protein [Nitrospirota bacterium]
MEQVKIKVNLVGSNEELLVTLKENITDDGYSVWRGAENGSSIVIDENRNGAVINVEKSDNIATDTEGIITEFLKLRNQSNETASSGIEPTDEGSVKSEPHPYDPEKIRVDTKPFSLKQTYELIESGDIDLSPDFQRHFVWKEIKKQSRLIESIMLRIPIPVFYLSQDNEGRFQVVDGLQRLTVIRRFINNEFALRDLEYLTDCNNCFYNYNNGGEPKKILHPKYTRRIEQTQLIFNIIDPQTPFRVKYDLFRRINEGGTPLNSQEIRNCMAKPYIRKFIDALANSEDFIMATDNSIKPLRMQDQEMVLRFIGFYYIKILGKSSYNGDMEDLLDKTLDSLNKENEHVLNEIKESFTRAMKNSSHLFGKTAFRKCLPEHIADGARKQFLNKLLFLTWSVSLAQFDTQNIEKNNDANCLVIPHANELQRNNDYTDYYYALTHATNDKKNVDSAFERVQSIIKQYIRY